MASELRERGFQDGSAPGALVIGWNSGHAAVTLPDGTPVSSGESGDGVAIGGQGAFQPQFTNHMYLPMAPEDQPVIDPALAPAPEPPAPEPIDIAALNAPPPPPAPDFVTLAFEPNPPAPEQIPAPPEPAPEALPPAA